ncbi:hypothetical protein GCM10009416_18680 [Craurococcus roseus]|uniref:Uncharacterized protein n=1 Tax=Craurococcus roseus TaxID=77585 RepID=A0ABN1F2C7_9PROT
MKAGLPGAEDEDCAGAAHARAPEGRAGAPPGAAAGCALGIGRLLGSWRLPRLARRPERPFLGIWQAANEATPPNTES